MIIKKTPTDTLLHTMSDVNLYEMFCEQMKNLEYLTRLEQVLVPEDKYEGPDEGPLEDLQLEEIEAATYNLGIKYLTEFQVGMCAPNSALLRRSTSAVEYLTRVMSSCESFAERYVPLSSKQVSDLFKITWEAIAEITHLLYYTFLLDKTASSPDDEVIVSSVVSKYCDVFKQQPKSVAEYLHGIMVYHRPHLKLEEAFPELVEELYTIIGPYLKDIERFEDYLTYELATMLVNGELTPDVIINYVEKQLSSEEE